MNVILYKMLWLSISSLSAMKFQVQKLYYNYLHSFDTTIFQVLLFRQVYLTLLYALTRSTFVGGNHRREFSD